MRGSNQVKDAKFAGTPVTVEWPWPEGKEVSGILLDGALSKDEDILVVYQFDEGTQRGETVDVLTKGFYRGVTHERDGRIRIKLTKKEKQPRTVTRWGFCEVVRTVRPRQHTSMDEKVAKLRELMFEM